MNRQIKKRDGPPSGTPLIRWAGGKRLIVTRLSKFLPSNFGTYFEPMVGGGALFFALLPRSVVLADVNPELMNFYRVIKDRPDAFYRAIKPLRASKTMYYRVRKSSPSSPLGRAVRFFYLIRLSWNGLYRVNRNGDFNVPFGGRRPKELVSLQAIQMASRSLREVRLLCGGFEKTTALAREGDLVYFDPPYPKGATDQNGFARYSSSGFSLEDHRRLAGYAAKLADRGVHVLITEAARKDILSLYSSAFKISLVRSSSLIAADSKFRRDAYEAILTSHHA